LHDLEGAKVEISGGEGILPMIYIASRNSSSTHHRSRPLIDNMNYTRVDESHILI